MKHILILISLIIFFTSCQAPSANITPTEAKRYPFSGKVISVDRTSKKAKVEHHDIPGYMDAMTMDFPIREDWVWDELKAGSEIRAELVVDNANGQYWLEKIAISAAQQVDNPVPINENFVQIGREVPDFTLTDQGGKRFSFKKDFKGKALAITFIYRECPLPDYCIKMSRNFSDIANTVNSDPALKQRIRLLSISFDPDRDTPEKLKQYGLGYLGSGAKDLGVWTLAVGSDKEVRKVADFFGLRYEVDQNDKTQINHSLRTIVIGPEGKVLKIYAGNDWSSEELLNDLKSGSVGSR
jgi:protein SCO1